MATMLNINGSADPSYRYKMPKIIGKIEGRGNGIKTVIVNADQVAQALKRPTEQLTKYIALEFSALCYDLEGKQTINGKFETADLQSHVQSYIKRFVLCPACGNPETVQVLRGKGKQANVTLECKACGEKSEADNLHKLKTLIVKELTEKEKRLAVEKAAADKDGEGSGSGGDAEGGEKKVKKEKKEKKEKSEKKSKKKKSEKDGGEKDEKKSKKKKKDKKSKENGDADDEINSSKVVARAIEDANFKSVVDEVAPLFAVDPLDEDKVVKSTVAALREKGLSKDDVLHVVWALTVAKSPRPHVAVEKYGKLLDMAVNEIGMEEGPAYVLSCVEDALVGVSDDSLDRAIKTVPLVLKALFDADVLDQGHIVSWFAGKLVPQTSSVNFGLKDEALANKAKLQSKPVIDWLLADSSDEDSDDDEDDDDSPRAASNKKKSSKSDTDSSDDDDDDDDE